MHPKMTAYLQLARLSNIPTVFSNVLVGFTIAEWFGPYPWSGLLLPLFVASTLYVGGMALNDLLDRHIDAKERPQRPIPSGRLSVREVSIFTALCFVVPVAVTAFLMPGATVYAIALALAIILYDVLHKRWSASLIFMGLCRALVYALAASMYTGAEKAPMYMQPVLLLGAILALYIIGLTVIAQKEVQGGLGFRRWLAVGMIGLPFLILLSYETQHPIWTLATGITLSLWLARSARFIRMEPPKVVPAVLGWLAGISLIDAFFLTFTHRPELSLVAFGCFAVTVWGHRKIAGT